MKSKLPRRLRGCHPKGSGVGGDKPSSLGCVTPSPCQFKRIKISLCLILTRAGFMNSAQLPFSDLTTMLKAAGEAPRLRLLMLIAEAELTVTDLTAILRQSQPRLSRHLRLLAEAGLVERHREGSWAFFRLGEAGSAADIARALIARLDPNDPIIARDRERLAGVRSARAAAAQNYFRRHAAQWDRIRRLHVADTAVGEDICAGIGDRPIGRALDLASG